MRTIIVPVTICVQSGRGPFLLAFGHRLNLRFMPEYIVNESPRRRRLEAPERDQRHRAAQTVADDLKLRQLSRDDLDAHPTSAAPFKMSATVCSVLTVVRNARSRPGCESMNDSKSGANRWTKACVAAATRTRPVGERSRPEILSRIASVSSRIRSTYSSAILPACESFTPRLARMKSGSPKSSSSALI